VTTFIAHFNFVGWGTYWREERCIQGSVGRLTERDHLKDKSENGRTILKWIFKNCYGDMD
jgi:hypothetical protein